MKASRIAAMMASRGRPSRARALLRARRGQAATEFLLMMVIILLVSLMVIEISFLGTDLLIARYASFVGARGYLCREPMWEDGAKQVGSLVVKNTGSMYGTALGDGVRFTVEIEEFIPLRTLFGDSSRTDLIRETYLGEPEPPLSGDNKARNAPGG